MTQERILQIAMEQSAEDCGADASDFLAADDRIVPFRMGAGARKYLKQPIGATLISYGSNVVAAVLPEITGAVKEYLEKFEYYHLFETPNIHFLDERIIPLGWQTCFMAEYWLPELASLQPRSCAYETRLLAQKDFSGLYLPEWSNALCADRRELDVLGVGAYDDGRLVGLAACSADCEPMWQIGIDVLPDYRRQGVASALTARLAVEILNRGKVPFYCCAWSNLASARNAIRSGFRPAWTELSVKPTEKIREMIR